MSHPKRPALWMALGAASALGLAWFIRRQRQATSNLHIWGQVLARHHGPQKAGQLIASLRQEQAALIAATPLPANPALRWHLTENILPGLALYRLLLQEHAQDRQAALAEVDEAFRQGTLAKNRFLLAPFKILPAPFRAFKPGLALMMKKFPTEGWDFISVENSDNKIAFNTTRCFYLNTLTAHGAPELTASFCKTDEVMAELFPASIRFVRPHTLGRGDALCDFQYCRVEEA